MASLSGRTRTDQTARGFQRSELRDGMRIDWNVPIEMDDGVVLRGDVYRPVEDGHYPAIMNHGPYAKGLPFQEAFPMQWQKMVADRPDVAEGSTCKYQNWEAADPEKWVPEGYVCVRVDSRGAGCSPGYLDAWSPRETRDFYECIEWAARQPWSNGKVGLLGISYYAMNQWQVAGLQPPHLTAMIPWEGAADFYRDSNYHGGIPCRLWTWWYPKQVTNVQYGLGERAARNPNTGDSIAGPETLSDEELARNRADLAAETRAHALDDEWHRARSAEWSRVEVPFLSAGNWGGQGLHPRGNFEGFTRAASKRKWLEVHGDTHWTHFYSDYGLALQKRFFDYFLKGVDNGWGEEAPVLLNIRHPGPRFELRREREWPLARTNWTKLYLNPGDMSLSREPLASAGTVQYEGLGDGVTFSTPPLERTMEITGPLAAKLFVSSATPDGYLFLVMRVFDPNGEEVVFQGSNDPHTPIANGWLRASHRKLDRELSKEYRPYHPHDEAQPLNPGEVYEVDVEIWPTCIVVPKGYRVALTVRGKDYEFEGELSEWGKAFDQASKGTGPFLHNDPVDRPPGLFGGPLTLHAGGGRDAYLLVPVIPSA